MPQIAIAQICVDDRLNHEVLRIQVRNKLAELYLRCDQVFVVNEVGGNMGSNFKNTVKLVEQMGNQLVFAAVLHHDDCRAARFGFRLPLEETVGQVVDFLRKSGVSCVLASGEIYTNNSYIVWQNEQRIRADAPALYEKMRERG